MRTVNNALLAAAALVMLIGLSCGPREWARRRAVQDSKTKADRVEAASTVSDAGRSPLPQTEPETLKTPVPADQCTDDTGIAQSMPAPPLPPAPKGIITHGDRRAPRVAITFDACENEHPAGFDQKIWSILIEKKVKATIFLGGKWMESHPDETRMIGRNPLIEIGNHSWIHPDFRKLSPQRAKEEIARTQDMQWRLMGKQGRLFRFPFGTFDDHALEIVAAAGLRPIQWDVVSGDPDHKVIAKNMIPSVLDQARKGSIIIFHINGRGWHTAEALPAIVDGLRAKGFELVTVSELLGLDEAPSVAAARPPAATTLK